MFWWSFAVGFGSIVFGIGLIVLVGFCAVSLAWPKPDMLGFAAGCLAAAAAIVTIGFWLGDRYV